MAEAAVYLTTLWLFSFVVSASAMMRHEMLLLACMPPVFVALIVGFIMALYAGDVFGAIPTCTALILGIFPARVIARRFQPRDLLIGIYLGWAVALVLALISFGFDDRV